ncbi:histidine phosphatase family protein [Hyphomicrobiales bacterium BP6-180914]|uniref:Histidine phosphatase family protein n=2 Tax=Lichenifustis flavocetrariae TaxID=2949735 RepID=A0AA41YT03_9HYPH|nr:histidine phosphatase family protein [Lichenifustis flavocetrariae]
MITLALLRHAKAVAEHPAGDHERALSPAGRRAAVGIGRLLVASLSSPILLLVSDAARTRQTAELAFPAAADQGVTTRLETALYAASAGAILSCLQDVQAEHPTVVIVGHNPGLGDLAQQLAGRGAAPDLARLQSGFPTGGAAIFTFDSSWSEVRPGSGELTATLAPDGIEWPA